MTCEDMEPLLSERWKGALTERDERRLAEHLASCAACRDEAESLSEIWSDLEAPEVAVPSARMRARFLAALRAYEEGDELAGNANDHPAGNASFRSGVERRVASRLDRLPGVLFSRRAAIQAAAAAALLAIGVLVGRSLPSSTDREIASLRDEIRLVGRALLDHQSASERLRGVAWSRQLPSNERAIEALLETVRHDPSINVRLAAVEALSQHVDRPQVGAGLAAALEQQDSPLMQVTLARVLLEGAVDGSASAVARMLEREDLDPSVRDYFRMVLAETGAGGAVSGEVL